MELQDKLVKIFNADYAGSEAFLNEVIRPVVCDEVDMVDVELLDEDDKYRERAKHANIKSIRYVADIENIESDHISFFDVTLFDNSSITRSRVAIQQLLRSIVESHSHLLIVFHYENVENRPWRFSYAYKEGNVAGMTTAKRFTYIFGKDFRSRTASERFVALSKTKKSDDDFNAAFSVETLSDEFFDRYRELYADFVQYITGKRFVKDGGKWVEKSLSEPNPQYESTFDKDDKLVRDYIKKMFGRIVFLYFLQRKGWLNGDLQYMHNLYYNSDKKDNFLDGVLEALFFEVLNTDKPNRTEAAKALPGSDNIPYLNGGLFAEDEIDALNCVFPEEYFKTLFDFLDSYNFTIDENDVEDAEIGIDPEMLGRIFENLLEDNKDKGAFYTPKEIVNYMCKESIIAYLQDERFTTDGNALIRQFVETLDGNLLSKEQRIYIKNKLKSVKICDPAIGSGAFPMGLVNLLSRLYSALRISSKEGEIKRHIIENSIYGVDIEKGAVDIARLRFWLAMIVEEKEPIPLPNLDFKIMQGNSLIVTFNDKYINISDKQQHKNLARMRAIKRALNAKQKKYFTKNGDEKLKLEISIKDDILSIIANQLGYELESWVAHANSQGSLFPEMEEKEITMAKIKSVVTGEKQEIVQFGEKLRARLIDENLTLEERAKTDLHFFDWEIMFFDVFEQGGFDIVIGNPPYVNIANIKNEEYRQILKTSYHVTKNKCDLYAYFVELGFSILKQKGILAYIIPHTWKATDSFTKLREIIFKSNTLKQIVNLDMTIFDAVVLPLIAIMQKGKVDCNEIEVKDKRFNFVYSIPISEILSSPLLTLDTTSTAKEKELFKHIELDAKKLSSIVKFSRGIKTSNDSRFIARECKSDEYKKVYRGRNIKSYTLNWDGEYVWYRPDLMREKVGCVPHSTDFFEVEEKLITQRVNSSHQLLVAYDDRMQYFLDTTNVSNIKTWDKITPFKLLCGILNSKLINFWYSKKYTLPTIGGYELDSIPIKNGVNDHVIIQLVDEILTSGVNESLRNKIDFLVYKEYGVIQCTLITNILQSNKSK